MSKNHDMFIVQVNGTVASEPMSLAAAELSAGSILLEALEERKKHWDFHEIEIWKMASAIKVVPYENQESM